MSNTSVSGLFVRPSPFPNINHPNRKGWFSSKDISFSPEITHNVPHVAASGANCAPVIFTKRLWNVSAPPARDNSENVLDLTTPSYRLAGNDETKDSVVGIDHFNPPKEFAAYLKGSEVIHNSSDTNTSFSRVLAIRHSFVVRNFSRFPLCLYYCVFPPGFEPPDLNTTSPIDDMIGSPYKKVVVAGVRDANDQGKPGHINITMNLEKMFPDQYEATPYVKGGDTIAIADNAPSPWMRTIFSTTGSMFHTVPPGQMGYNVVSDTGGENVDIMPALKMKMFARLDTPMWLGSTASTAGASGDIATNGFTITGNMNWLIQYVNMSQRALPHPGEKAYPSQVD